MFGLKIKFFTVCGNPLEELKKNELEEFFKTLQFYNIEKRGDKYLVT